MPSKILEPKIILGWFTKVKHLKNYKKNHIINIYIEIKILDQIPQFLF
jgi:hypothetical protein